MTNHLETSKKFAIALIPCGSQGGLSALGVVGRSFDLVAHPKQIQFIERCPQSLFYCLLSQIEKCYQQSALI